MFTHISMFWLNDPSDAEKMSNALQRVNDPRILSNTVGTNAFLPPPIEGGPDFADVVQILTFASEEDAAAYPASDTHITLQKETNHLIARVAGIDFET